MFHRVPNWLVVEMYPLCVYFFNHIPNSKDCQLINLVGFPRILDFTWMVVNMDFIVEEIVGCQSKEKV